MTAPQARQVHVEGIVQGVGFRPFVWRLAQELGLAGWVRNHGGSVDILAEGTVAGVELFCRRLVDGAPPLARVDRIDVTAVAATHARTFEVVDSAAADGAATARRLVTPDAATCDACVAELWDPDDRRHRYPFVNCTDCGPRFTIIDDLPYDRSRTSMAEFQLCDACAREYHDPADRRFHAEPVACPRCGPALALVDRRGLPISGDPIGRAVELLCSGGIVAVKGLGGYQLACDATDATAVAELRRRKHRPDKPLAVMVADLATADGVADVSTAEVALLRSAPAPIVVVRSRGALAPQVAPGHGRVGLMLPTTPLHHLLIRGVDRPLVMTSGNRSDEPIATDDHDARFRLGDIADAFVVHDRRIRSRYDDSVASVRRGAPAVSRRARGFAPAPITLPVSVDPIIGVGAELQATFCLAAGTDAFVSSHIGDIDNDAAVVAYRSSLDHHRRLLRIDPGAVAHDLHPDLHTTRIAETLGLPLVGVQHHHAHVVSVMAEHGVRDRALGVAFDGFGLGTDGTAWGGEFLECGWGEASRLAHLRRVRQPGADAAVRHPARMALAYARDAGCFDAALEVFGLADGAPAAVLEGATPSTLVAQCHSGLGSPLTSSAGRLFDAVAALAGVCRTASYEGQPAILLEQSITGVGPSAVATYPVAIASRRQPLEIDTRPLIAAVIDDVLAGVPAAMVATRFHAWLAAAVVEMVLILVERSGLRTICLAGGVWANDVLLGAVADELERVDLTVLFPRALPPGDGGLSLGQVLVAHAMGVC